MKVDIATLKCGKYGVFPREGAPEAFDDYYEADFLFGPAEENECVNWCDANGHEYRMRRRVSLVPENFVHELEEKCDKWRKSLDENASRCGRKLFSDCIYKASAAWQLEPTHYAYLGDFGGCARLKVVEEGKSDADALILANQFLDFLCGAATAVWELGFTLTFDENGRHTVYGNSPQWVTAYTVYRA